MATGSRNVSRSDFTSSSVPVAPARTASGPYLWSAHSTAGSGACTLHCHTAAHLPTIAFSPDVSVKLKCSDRQISLGRGYAIISNLSTVEFQSDRIFKLVLLSWPSQGATHDTSSGSTDCVVCPPTPAFSVLRGYTAVALQYQGRDPELDALAMSHIAGLGEYLIASKCAARATSSRPANARVARLLHEIGKNALNPEFTLSAMAEREGITARYLQQLLASAGTSFSASLDEARLQKALQLLQDRPRSGLTIGAVAFAAGFNDISTFNRRFKRRFGYPPSSVEPSAEVRNGDYDVRSRCIPSRNRR